MHRDFRTPAAGHRRSSQHALKAGETRVVDPDDTPQPLRSNQRRVGPPASVDRRIGTLDI